jgi:hypothetical protein
MNVTGMYGDNGEIWMNVALKKNVQKNHDLRQTIFYSNRDDNNGT